MCATKFVIIYSLISLANVLAKPLDANLATTCGYESCHPVDPNKINVHIVPHSHDDVGWLKTVDQYFFDDVNNVIGSVIVALKQNPDRRFVQVETAFFKMWWVQQTDQIKNDTIQLVNEGRLEIINAAWSMNDEAAVHYQSTIDQFTLGLRYIEDNLGKCARPRIGWQIDPFGHSREQASIFAQLGFDAFFFARLDYRDRSKRYSEKTTDMLWTSSANLGSESNIFTSVLHNHYSAPSGFCFDHVCNDAPIVDDEDSVEYNLDQRVNDFVNAIKDQSGKYPTNNIMVTMGDDFRYKAALTTYINLDRLIRGFELFNPTIDGKEINLIYSTPSCYAKAVHDEVVNRNMNLTVITDDFFPYADGANAVWSGYFTSRASSKRYERQANNLLQVARQVSALAGLPHNANNLLEQGMGVMQHHDAITGTEKQAVEKEYHRFLTKGITQSIDTASEALSALTESSLELTSCLLQNVSVCLESKKDEFQILLYNPLGRSVSHYIQVPVDSDIWEVTGPTGDNVPSQIVDPVSNFDYVSSDVSSRVLVFQAENIPAVGYSVYTFKQQDSEVQEKPKLRADSRVGFDNTYIELDEETGLLKSITMNGVTMEVTQEMLYYQSATQSGAYIFRTDENTRDAQKFTDKVTNTINDGTLMKEVRQEFRDWAIQTIRIYENEDFIEIDWLVGPIDVGDDIGKEIITRFTTNLETNGIFYTDSNGRELIERKRNYRATYDYTNEEPQAGNYYPVGNRILIRDETSEFAVITDRSEGGSSLNDGELEIMLHRGCLHDDGRGVAENLYEIEYEKGLVVRGSLYVTLGQSKTGNGQKSMAAIERDIAIRKHVAPWIFYPQSEVQLSEGSFVAEQLPENVHLLTLAKWDDSANTYLIRLEHTLELNDDENLSQEVTVDVAELFTTFRITSLIETTLAGVTPLEESSRFEWPQISKTEPESSPLNIKNRLDRAPDDTNITLAPMQIRTFIATVEKRK